MIRVGIVADDLTGAADTASQFVRAGWHTELQLRPGASTAQVLAVTTDSRGLAASDAAKVVSAAVAQLRDAGVTQLYKKIDSTLRGQLGAEIRAALDAWSRNAIAVVCPAFPTMGRTLVDGRLLVNGVPVSDTTLGADPMTPVTQSHIPTILGGSLIAHNAGESARSLADRIEVSGAIGPIVVVDAADDDQLQRLAKAIALLGPRAISVGSAGLAGHLARVWTPEESTSLRPSSESSVMKGTVKSRITIVLVTSLQDVARRQAAAVAAAGALHAQPAPEDLIDDGAWERWSATILESVGTRASTVLLTAPPPRRKALSPELIPERFAKLTARIVRKAGVEASGVVVTGGDGARAVARALDATGFQILGEVASGVPMGTLVGGPANGLRFVTKAGGFGGDETLVQAIQAIGGGGQEVAPRSKSLPLLGITIGDVAGIGPEITVKTLLRHPELRLVCRPVAIGDADALRRAVTLIGEDPAAVRTIEWPSDATNDSRLVEVVQEGAPVGHVAPGALSAVAGDAAARYVIRACALARAGALDGIVTAPLNKAAMHAGGHNWPGHTELLAHEFGVDRFSLVLSAGDLYLFHVTTHVSLRRAIELLTRERILEVLRLAAGFARALGTPGERIGVAGLNPHAGESRLFGDEDADVIAPAVRAAQAEGINAVGPVPADALMPAAVRGEYRLVVACYHDQGHAPFKSVYGDAGVNITAGLPVVRVSVDHGTAFDIAGKGIAREASLVLAAQRAAALVPGWK